MRSKHPIVQFHRTKFKQLVLHICANCDPERLGAVKLHKILYLADMVQFALHGNAITGSTYVKRPLGPMSRHLLPVLRELQQDGAIRVSVTDYFRFKKTNYHAANDADLSLFSEEEIALIRDVIDFVANQNTAKTISDFSHTRAWEMAEYGEEIPYHSAFALFPNEPSPETVDWAVSVSGQVEAERSKRPAMDYESFAAFRGRVQAHRA